MTITAAPAVPAARRPDPVECSVCGGEVLPVGRKVGPHNQQLFGPLRLDGERLTDPLGRRAYGVFVSDKPCPGGGLRPAEVPVTKRAKKVQEDVLRRLVEEEHLTDEEAAARLGCSETTVRRARQRAVPPIPPGRGNPTLAGYEPPVVDAVEAVA